MKCMVKRYKKTEKKSWRFKFFKFKFKKKLLIPLLAPVSIFLVLFGLFYFFWLKDLPSPTRLSATTGSYSSQIYDRNGKLLYTLYSDRNQTFVPLKKIPKYM